MSNKILVSGVTTCFLLSHLALFGALSGCGKKSKDENEEAAPEIPASETLVMSTSSLQSGGNLTTSAGANFGVAYLTVSATSVAVALQLALPAAAISKALEQTAKKEGDGSWSWIYSFVHSGTSYNAILKATTGTGASLWDWALGVSKSPLDSNGCCTNFTWLSGSRTSATSGVWTINDAAAPASISPLRTVDWQYTSATDKSLKVGLSKVDDSTSEWAAGGYVKLAISGAANVMTIDKTPVNAATIVVNWDSSTKVGSMVKEDGTKVCWDTSLADVTCP